MDIQNIQVEHIIQKKIDIYHFDLSKIGLPVEYLADLVPGEESVEIQFEDGKFYSADYHFYKSYERSKWKLLAIINDIITELEEIHGKQDG